MKKEEIITQYKNNYARLEKVVKLLNTKEEDRRKNRTAREENYYNLQDKKITADLYLKNNAEYTEKEEKINADLDLLRIEEKLLQDNENILIDKLIILINNNIISKYNNIGEKTTQKIDAEIKDYLKDLYNSKYFNIVEYNNYCNYLPNQFIHFIVNNESWRSDYYDKKLSFYLYSKLNNRNEYKQDLFIKNNVIKLNEYSRTAEEITKDNTTAEEKIQNTEIEQDTKRKAKEILKAYNKKKKLLDEIEKKKEEIKKEFDNTIKNNTESFYHNLYSYFYR